MAKETVVILTDDLDGSEADHTVRFSYENYSYEIDLSDENANVLFDFLKPYMNAGRRTGGKTTSKSAGRSGAVAWARAQGLVSETHRGRLPKAVQEAYDAAH